MQERVKIVLKSGKEQSLRRFHPWIFSGAIKKMYGTPAEGDLVDVYDNKDEFLAVGHYAPSSIAVRVLSFEQETPDISFFREKIKRAINYRKAIGIIDNPQINVFRLIHGEGDGLPGLIVDFYNGVAVMQMHSIGFYRIRKEIASILSEELDNRITAVYDKSEGTIPHMSSVKATNEFLSEDQNQLLLRKMDINLRLTGQQGKKQDFLLIRERTENFWKIILKEDCIEYVWLYRGIFCLCNEKCSSCAYCGQFVSGYRTGK